MTRVKKRVAPSFQITVVSASRVCCLPATARKKKRYCAKRHVHKTGGVQQERCQHKKWLELTSSVRPRCHVSQRLLCDLSVPCEAEFVPFSVLRPSWPSTTLQGSFGFHVPWCHCPSCGGRALFTFPSSSYVKHSMFSNSPIVVFLDDPGSLRGFRSLQAPDLRPGGFSWDT